MKSTFLVFAFCLGFLSLTAQSENAYTRSADSDPAARALLEQVRKKYEGYRNVKAQFELTLAFPNQPEELQEGMLYRKGDQYRLELAGQEVISDGEAIWFIQKANKEVQINDVPEADQDVGVLSPQSLFTIYERDDFVYVMGNKYSRGGKPVQEIIFKPLESDSDYAKLQLEINPNNAEIQTLKAFAKDGSRYTLEMKNVTPNASIPAGLFTFKKEDYPDYYVEDLRY